MKKLLAILVLGLLWCNVGFAKDLTGTKLSCLKLGANPDTAIIYFFKTSSQVVEYDIYFWDLMIREKTYRVRPDKIKIGIYTDINRETLRLYHDTPCKILDENFDIDSYMNSLLDEKIKAQESKNKL